jgi:autotransporter-associated beta strand protein
VNGFLYVSGNTLYLNVLAPSLAWDITDTSDQTINDGSGTWSTDDALWNDGTPNDVNIAWDNAANAEDIAAFGSTTNGTVNVRGAITLGGITFNSIPGTNAYAIAGGSLTTTNNGSLMIINNDSGNDRRTSGGASIGSKLTGNMSLVFAGSGDNVTLGNSGNDFVGQIQMSGGGVQISSNAQLGHVSNRITVIDAGSYLRNSAAITVGRDIALSSGRVLQLVNGGNLLTHMGVISGGDVNSMLVIGAGHGPGNGGHRVYLHGTNTLSGTIRIYDQLRAYEGEGLSANANVTLGNAIGGSVNAPNTAGILETSGDFVRTVGTGAGQFQWAADSYHSGGFAAVGGPLTVSFGGSADPAALTWAGTSGFLISGAELRFQNINANGAVTWKNPVNLNSALRTVYIGASSYAVTFDAALSGTGNSGLIKAGTGMLVLGADSSYAGLTVISVGTLQVGKGSFSGTLGAGTVTNNSKIVINRSNAYNLTNLMVGSGSLLKLGEGTLTLSAANTYSGATTVSNGTLAAGCDRSLNGNSALFLSGGTFDAGSFSNALGVLSLSAGSVNALTVNSGCRLSFSGMSGAGTLIVAGKLGPTSLRIGTNAYSLTLPQLKQITTSNGGSVYLDVNGYMLATPPGTILRLL